MPFFGEVHTEVLRVPGTMFQLPLKWHRRQTYLGEKRKGVVEWKLLKVQGFSLLFL